MTDTIATADAPAAAPVEAAPAAAPAPAAPTLAGGDVPAPAPAEAAAAAPADAPTDGDQPVAAKPAGAPEQYEAFAMPEGVDLDSQVVDGFTEVAKELNLPQDAAQKVIDKVAPIMAARQAAQMEAVRNEWHAQSSADKEFGGDKLQESTALAAKAMAQFSTPELKGMLNETGLGNHPEIVRLMVRVGQALSEDRIVTGGQKPSGIRSMADALYPSDSSKK